MPVDVDKMTFYKMIMDTMIVHEMTLDKKTRQNDSKAKRLKYKMTQR